MPTKRTVKTYAVRYKTATGKDGYQTVKAYSKKDAEFFVKKDKRAKSAYATLKSTSIIHGGFH